MTEKLPNRCPSLLAGARRRRSIMAEPMTASDYERVAIDRGSIKLSGHGRVPELFFNLLDFLLKSLIQQTCAFAPRFAFWVRLRGVSSHFAAVNVLVPFLLALEFCAQFVFGHFLTYIEWNCGRYPCGRSLDRLGLQGWVPSNRHL